MKNIATLAGCIAGIITFIAVGLQTAMLYGGYAGLLLASGTVGAHSVIGRMIIVFGMSLGTIGACSLFAVIGSIVGTLLGAVLGIRNIIAAR